MKTALLLACILSSTLCAAAADRRVYKVDTVSAARKNGVIILQAKGAVRSGGWTAPRLKVIHNGGEAVITEFSATPPPPGMTVIEALVPITAQTRIRSHAASVHVEADVNEMTTQVLRETRTR